MTSHDDHPARCPRCRYDLSAIPATWEVACPLEGVCSECGLVVQWCDLLSPRLAVPRWFFEGDNRGRFSFMRTAVTVLMPGRFWQGVRMVHPIRMGRLAAFVLLLVLMTYVSGFALRVGQSLVIAQSFGPINLSVVLVMLKVVVIWPYYYWTAPWHFSLVIWPVLIAVVFAILSDSLHRSRVHWAHVVRATAYSMTFVAAACIAYTLTSLCTSFIWAYGNWATWGWVSPALDWAVSILMVVAVLLWWASATRRYMALERWWAVWLTVVGVSGLGAFVLAVWRHYGLVTW